MHGAEQEEAGDDDDDDNDMEEVRLGRMVGESQMFWLKGEGERGDHSKSRSDGRLL